MTQPPPGLRRIAPELTGATSLCVQFAAVLNQSHRQTREARAEAEAVREQLQRRGDSAPRVRLAPGDHLGMPLGHVSGLPALTYLRQKVD